MCGNMGSGGGSIAMQDYIDGKGWNEAILGKKK